MAKRLPPYLCVLAAAILVIVVPPPAKLVDLIGSDTWARLGLAALVTLVLFMLLVVLGLAAGKVGLPFGLSLERSDPPATATLVTELNALREADQRIFERIGELATLLEFASERITLLEDDQPPAGPNDA
jgi:hypothetical protein